MTRKIDPKPLPISMIEKKNKLKNLWACFTRWIPENANMNSLAKFVLGAGDLPNKQQAELLHSKFNDKTMPQLFVERS